MRTTVKAVIAEAARIGASVEHEAIGNVVTCRVESPLGHVWIGGLHEFVDTAYRPWKPDYADLLARMAYGFEPCATPDCEWCGGTT